jgi:NET1-associated nuclear protein 1 (U3 small nucleolar RNA-associated protein 17)
MVLWQLDTGRKSFLPHLSSPICNLVVSASGSSYVVKLADNSVMVLSTRELQPLTSITGLQLSPDAGASVDPTKGSVVAKLHPQQPERLIVSVPASHQFTQSQHGSQPANAAVLQTYDIRANSNISRQALARTNATTLNISPEGTSVIAPDVKHLDIVHDAKWLATVDSWAPHTQDVQALDRKAAALHPEVFLKFWKWDASSDTWELVTRVDGPHFSANHHSAVLGLASRPGAHEFATLGADSNLRFWCPTVKHRSGLKAKDQPEQPMNTWKCRGIVDLKGCLDTTQDSPLKSACMTFSEDGSVLAVCLPSTSAANDGLVLLIDARTCVVHYRRTGVFLGNPCSTSFLGSQLIVASTHSVAAWNTVDDVVQTIQSSDSVDSHGTGNSMIAVNARTKSLAITSATAHKKKNKARLEIKIYDVPSFEVVFQEALKSAPVSLLADAYSGDYIVIDTAATVQRLGCLDKAYQKSQNNQSRDVTGQIDSGLSTLFSRGAERQPVQADDVTELSSQTKGLASVFGETPSFSLPAIGVLFRNVVQTLGAN